MDGHNLHHLKAHLYLKWNKISFQHFTIPVLILVLLGLLVTLYLYIKQPLLTCFTVHVACSNQSLQEQTEQNEKCEWK